MTPARPTVDVDELRRTVTAVVCNVSNLPEPMQAPALGLNMGPLIDLLTDRVAAHLAAVTAERDEAVAAVERVRIVRAKYAERSTWKGFEGPRRLAWKEAADDLRAALSPAPTSNTEETP